MNKRKLRAKMQLFGDNGLDVARYIGVSRSTFSAKLNETNGGEFTQNEIAKLKKKYNLTADEVDEIFFTNAVS